MKPVVAFKVIAQVAPEHHVAFLEYLSDCPVPFVASSTHVYGAEKGISIPKKRERIEGAAGVQVANGKEAAEIAAPSPPQLPAPDAKKRGRTFHPDRVAIEKRLIEFVTSRVMRREAMRVLREDGFADSICQVVSTDLTKPGAPLRKVQVGKTLFLEPNS